MACVHLCAEVFYVRKHYLSLLVARDPSVQHAGGPDRVIVLNGIGAIRYTLARGLTDYNRSPAAISQHSVSAEPPRRSQQIRDRRQSRFIHNS
jgi:hypothetical protein